MADRHGHSVGRAVEEILQSLRFQGLPTRNRDKSISYLQACVFRIRASRHIAHVPAELILIEGHPIETVVLRDLRDKRVQILDCIVKPPSSRRRAFALAWASPRA